MLLTLDNMSREQLRERTAYLEENLRRRPLEWEIRHRKLKSGNRASEARLAEVIRRVVVGVSEIDEHGRYINISDPYARMFGISPADMVGREWTEFFAPVSMPDVGRAYADMMASGSSIVTAQGSRPDGTLFWVSSHLVRHDDQADQFRGHHCFSRDVSEWFALQADHREQRNLLRKLMDCRETPVLLLSNDGGLLEWNSVVTSQFDLDPATLPGANVADLLVPAQWREVFSSQIGHGWLMSHRNPGLDFTTVLENRVKGQVWRCDCALVSAVYQRQACVVMYVRSMTGMDPDDQKAINDVFTVNNGLLAR